MSGKAQFKIDPSRFFSTLGNMALKYGRNAASALPGQKKQVSKRPPSLRENVELLTSLCSRVTSLGPVKIDDHQVSVRPSLDADSDSLILFENIDGAKSFSMSIELTEYYYGSASASRVIYREGSFGRVTAQFESSFSYIAEEKRLAPKIRFHSNTLSNFEFNQQLAYFNELLKSALWERLSSLRSHPFEIFLADFFNENSSELSNERIVPVLSRVEEHLSALQDEKSSLRSWEIIHSEFKAKPVRTGVEITRDSGVSNSLTLAPSHSFLFRNIAERKNFTINFNGTECRILASGIVILKAKKTAKGYELFPGYGLTSSGQIALKIARIFD